MDILFLGGDERMRYAADILAKNHRVCFSGENFPVVVLPVPLTKDGANVFAPLSPSPVPLEDIPRYAAPAALVLAGGCCPRLTEICRANSLTLVDYFASETLTLRNAALTAESAVMLLSQSTDGSLLGARTLITGFGRIAKALAARLAPFGCDITITARRREALCEARLGGFSAAPLEAANLSDFDFIVNTVPAALFSAEDFSQIKSGCVFLELASLPDSPPADNVKYVYGAGLPGRYSPRTAGRFIAEELLRVLPDIPTERTAP